jgi:uncharacterized membrane protein
MEITRQFEDTSRQASAKQWIHSLWFRLLLIAAFALGIVFRLSGLGNKIYSHDEAYTSLYAAGYHKGEVLTSIRDDKDHTASDIQRFLKPGEDRGIGDTFTSILSGPQQSPLFFLLAHYWMRLVGHTPAAMRGLAAIFGLLSIPAMYWFSREVFQSQPIAVLSSALFAISPFHILFSQDARYYSLWTFATVVSSAALFSAIRRDNLRAWLVYSLALILGVYSHQLFILVAVVHGIYFAALFILHYKREFGGFLSACLIAFLAYTPWLFVMITYWDRAVGQMDWVNYQIPWYRYLQRWALIFSSPVLDFEFSFGNLIPYLLRALVLVLVAYSLVFLVVNGSKQQTIFLLLLSLIPSGAFIVPDMILGGIRSIGGRYFVPANIAIILMIAFLIGTRLNQARPAAYSRLKLLFGLLMVAGIASNLNSLLVENWWNKELGRVRPEFVDEIDKDRALLIVSTGYDGTTFGDILLLSLEVDSGVHFRIPQDPDDIEYNGNYDFTYWFPGSNQKVQEISKTKGLQVREVLENTLWRIEGNTE